MDAPKSIDAEQVPAATRAAVNAASEFIRAVERGNSRARLLVIVSAAHSALGLLLAFLRRS